MPRKKTDAVKESEKATTTVVNPDAAIPPVSEMRDLNAEMAKQRPTESGYTGYIRARIKAGK